MHLKCLSVLFCSDFKQFWNNLEQSLSFVHIFRFHNIHNFCLLFKTLALSGQTTQRRQKIFTCQIEEAVFHIFLFWWVSHCFVFHLQHMVWSNSQDMFTLLKPMCNWELRARARDTNMDSNTHAPCFYLTKESKNYHRGKAKSVIFIMRGSWRLMKRGEIPIKGTNMLHNM